MRQSAAPFFLSNLSRVTVALNRNKLRLASIQSMDNLVMIQLIIESHLGKTMSVRYSFDEQSDISLDSHLTDMITRLSNGSWLDQVVQGVNHPGNSHVIDNWTFDVCEPSMVIEFATRLTDGYANRSIWADWNPVHFPDSVSSQN